MLEFYGLEYSSKDHPDHFALILYTTNCNLRCYWCHNRLLAGWDYQKEKIININPTDYYIKLTEEEITNAINNDLIDIVILCWGEVFINNIDKIINTIKWIKKINPNIKIRIDSNWTFPEKIEKLVNLSLIDWLAIDIKWPYWDQSFYQDISKVIWLDINLIPNISNKILKSIKLADQLPYTIFRTVTYPIIKNPYYFEEIKNFVSKNLSKPHYFNSFYSI